MIFSASRHFKARLILLLRFFWRRKAIWIRIILSLSIGATFMLLDENTNYDLRFQIRGPQPTNPHIVLLEIGQNEWIDYHGRSRNLIRPLKEITSLTDSFFWNEKSWRRLLLKVLAQEPLAVGVSFYFGESLSRSDNQWAQQAVFSDERIIWSASLDSSGRTLTLPSRRITLKAQVSIRFKVTKMAWSDISIPRSFRSPISVNAWPLDSLGKMCQKSHLPQATITSSIFKVKPTPIPASVFAMSLMEELPPTFSSKNCHYWWKRYRRTSLSHSSG